MREDTVSISLTFVFPASYTIQAHRWMNKWTFIKLCRILQLFYNVPGIHILCEVCAPADLSHLRTCVTDMSPDDQWRFDWFTSQSNVATWDIIHEVYKQPPVFEIPPFIRKWKVNLWFHSVKNYGIFNTSCVLCTQWDNKSTYYTISNLHNSNLHIAH